MVGPDTKVKLFGLVLGGRPYTGALDVGPDVACRLLEMHTSYVSVALCMAVSHVEFRK